jgi:hypothetical protein
VMDNDRSIVTGPNGADIFASYIGVCEMGRSDNYSQAITAHVTSNPTHLHDRLAKNKYIAAQGSAITRRILIETRYQGRRFRPFQ